MDDDPDAMLKQTLIISALFWLAILSLVFLSACTQHKVDVSSSSVDKIVDKMSSLKPPIQCRKLDLPPVPDRVKLQIDGDKIDADAGGELLLRGYVACRAVP